MDLVKSFSNEYSVAKNGVDKTENEPRKVTVVCSIFEVVVRSILRCFEFQYFAQKYTIRTSSLVILMLAKAVVTSFHSFWSCSGFAFGTSKSFVRFRRWSSCQFTGRHISSSSFALTDLHIW